MVKTNAKKAIGSNTIPIPIPITVDPLTLTVDPLTLTVDPLTLTVEPLTLTVEPLIPLITPIKVKKIVKSKKNDTNIIAETVIAESVIAETVIPLTISVIPSVSVDIVKSKRGRKSKKELLASLNSANVSPSIHLKINELNIPSNIVSDINKIQTITDSFDTNVVVSPVAGDGSIMYDNDLDDDDNIQNIVSSPDQKPAIKKRGRKPKGGKIIQQVVPLDNQKIERPNVILHLKCSMKDLQISNNSSCLIESFNFAPKNELSYELLNDNKPYIDNKLSIQNANDECDDDDDDVSCKDNNKEIWRKLKQLEHNLHVNNINNKKSACFWCTCDFDNPPVYIPKHFINESYHVYGCFCSPECGVAHLMSEAIDSSAKFERYHLLNHIYSKIYEYKKNIKPAPNPYYMLEKFYGNLSIQEYRSLLRNERLFLIVDKPLTRILPELHEDNDEFILNNKIIPSNNYQLKSRMQKKKPNKGSILNEKFGLSNHSIIME